MIIIERKARSRRWPWRARWRVRGCLGERARWSVRRGCFEGGGLADALLRSPLRKRESISNRLQVGCHHEKNSGDHTPSGTIRPSPQKYPTEPQQPHPTAPRMLSCLLESGYPPEDHESFQSRPSASSIPTANPITLRSDSQGQLNLYGWHAASPIIRDHPYAHLEKPCLGRKAILKHTDLVLCRPRRDEHRKSNPIQ